MIPTLVTYYQFGVKVGYLVVEMMAGMAIVRTFLFLMNHGTPEGEKLQQIW